MVLILAHAHDLSARALAARWGSTALLITLAELHESRWCLEMSSNGRVLAELARADGTPVPVTGVVNRLGMITGADLPRVRAQDRTYAVAELTAFLLAWLDACPVPVLNAPNPRSLNGPAWYPEQWADAAASVGLHVDAVRRRVGLGAAPLAAVPDWDGAVVAASVGLHVDTVRRRVGLGAAPVAAVPDWDGAVAVHVVGDVCVGDVDPVLGGKLCALARLAGISLLTATVSGSRVRDISAWPDLADASVADAVAVALT